MEIKFDINSQSKLIDVSPSDTLLVVLRREGYFGVKFGGCQHNECGACTVLIDGKPVNSCSILAVQVEGHPITTIESEGMHPEKGWMASEGLSAIQMAFAQTGAVQCGYCTPAMILAAKALLSRNPNPSESEVRAALAPILCRCTGYLKPVQAVLAASERMREKSIRIHDQGELRSESTNLEIEHPSEETKERTGSSILNKWEVVGKSEVKVDAFKLVQGKPAFTDDIEIRDVLVGKILHSPVAHARIVRIDTSKAKAYPGVAAVLTWQDIPRVIYSTAGQSDPIPGPLDTFSLDSKVRFVGDRVAFVAAETEEIAEIALQLIDVQYEKLPPIFDPEFSLSLEAVKLHDEPEYINFANSNPDKNLAAEIRIDIGSVEKGFSEADIIIEGDYIVPKVQQSHIEPHVVVTYWDEDDRLVIRTSTQVPFHARRILAPVLKLPVKRIRVIKPRIGGGFGGKQEVLIEDAAAHLTIATGKPVRMVLSREEEFTSTRSRHPMRLHMKTGVKKDGTITANQMTVLSDTGAYGCHALTVTGNTGHKAMALYVGDGVYRDSPNIRFYADIVYTNTPPAGAFRGYGVPQGFWAVERHMDKIANQLHLDPIEFRLKNALRAGELHPFSTAWSEGREPKPEIIHTVGLEECVRLARQAIGWDAKYNNPNWHQTSKPHIRQGIGSAFVMQGTAIPYLDMGSALIKMNDDGSFNLMVGATDLGTGSDTVLGQMAAEVLGVPLEDILVYSSDTDFTPFDKGAYASSTTYISGTAVVRAALKVSEKIRKRAAVMLSKPEQAVSDNEISLHRGKAITMDGRSVTLGEVALNALHHVNQEQIMASASYVSPVAPPPFAAQFAEVEVDTGTGQVTVKKLVIAVDAGVIVNPQTASGQIEGGMTQALGYAVCEEMRYDEDGQALETDWLDYHIFRADEMPELETIFVETFEPSHPFGVKAVAEIPMDGVAPAVGNAIRDACGAEVNELPATPERVWKAIQKLQE